MKGPKISIVEDCEGCDYLQILQCKKKCVITNASLYTNRDSSIQPDEKCPFLRNKSKEHLKSELTKLEIAEIAEIEEIIEKLNENQKKLESLILFGDNIKIGMFRLKSD